MSIKQNVNDNKEKKLQNSETIVSNSKSRTSQFGQQIPILYLWFGQKVPQDYLISLSQMKYPIIFLKDPKVDRKWKRQILSIQMSDYYRLKYLYDHGGIYSDFDNHIDYDCLMELLKPYRNQDKVVFMTDYDTSRIKNNQLMNNFIFAPYPKMPILKQILDSIDQTQGRIWEFAGLKYLGRFEQPLEVEMYKCVQHKGDWSWFKDSNKVLNRKTQGRGEFIKKTHKKIDLIQSYEKLQFEVTIYRIGLMIVLLVGIIILISKKFIKQSKMKKINFSQLADY